METTIQLTDLATDVLNGLRSKPKYLNSKYFYDARGSLIFQKIMHMPEYYLTDCELEIFETQKQSIYDAFKLDHLPFDIVELGAGDGLKTKILLAHFLGQNPQIRYIPVDISEKAVLTLEKELKQEIPHLKVIGKIGDYFGLMEELSRIDKTPKVLLFLGSNIGNFNHEQAINFLTQVKTAMNPDDKLFIGFDLKKDPEIILEAYNDPHGYTASFNLNLLRRINEELGGDFELMKFKHHEVYNPQTGTAKSYLVSLAKQSVYIGAIDKTITFDPWEPIFMEMSQKYDISLIQNLAQNSGFVIRQNFYDSRRYFMNSLWELA
ncbi:MAG: L-histidine N(alpha)-methyltransferase [Bacteroidetes bacterium]|nr:L-histidine N(alpha)-methyltransferase [Bacteroidota bacterium]